MARELVTVRDDAPHQLRVALGDPAEREERRLGAGLLEQREDALDVALDAAGRAVPLRPRDVRRERRDLEVVLDVDRQRVDDHPPGLIGARIGSGRLRRVPRAEPVAEVSGDALRRVAVPQLGHAPALAAAGEDLVDEPQRQGGVAPDDGVGALRRP